MAINRRVPLQTPMFDAQGNLTRTWILFLESLAGAGSPRLTLQVDGTLAIGSDLAPIAALQAAATFSQVMAFVRTAPSGAGITLQVRYGSTTWLTLTIADGQTQAAATAAQMSAVGPLPGATAISLDLTAVGTTFPGEGLSVFLFP